MSHFKAKMNKILFPTSARSFVRLFLDGVWHTSIHHRRSMATVERQNNHVSYFCESPNFKSVLSQKLLARIFYLFLRWIPKCLKA